MLLPAAQALRYLLLPLAHSATYIPYLPYTLMSVSDAATLLNDSTSPYLIGVHSSLLSALGHAGHAIAPEVIVADLDKVGAPRTHQSKKITLKLKGYKTTPKTERNCNKRARRRVGEGKGRPQIVSSLPG